MKKLLITRLYNQKHNKIIYSNMHDEAGASSQEKEINLVETLYNS